MIKLYHTFPACSGDYHGFVSPNYMMREIDEGVAAANFAEGAILAVTVFLASKGINIE